MSTNTCPEIFHKSALILTNQSLFGYYFDGETNIFKICFFDVTPINGFENISQISPFIQHVAQQCNTHTLHMHITNVIDKQICILQIKWYEYEKICSILAYLLNKSGIIQFTICNFACVVLDRYVLLQVNGSLPCIVLPDYIEREFVRQFTNSLPITVDCRFFYIWNYITTEGCAFCKKLCILRDDSLSIYNQQYNTMNYLGWSDFKHLETIMAELNSEYDVQPFRSSCCCKTLQHTDSMCVLCTTNIANTHLIPCGHAIFCSICAPRKLAYFVDRTLLPHNEFHCTVCNQTIISYIDIIQH